MSHFTPRELPILSVAKKNASGSDMAKGVGVKLSQSADDEIALSDTPGTDVFFGVTRSIIKNGDWGDILVLGLAVVLGGETVTQGKLLTVGTGGKFFAHASSAGDTDLVAGVSNRDVQADVLTEMWLSGPGNSRQTED